MLCRRIFIASIALFAFTSGAIAQQGPAPGPEHKQLAKLVGEWEVAAEGMTGTAAYKMVLGGLWRESSFKGEFGGATFEGKGLDTYDAAKKKYISVWFDSMSASPLVMEGDYDKDGKVLTMEGEGPGFDGSPMKYKSVTEYTSDDEYVFTLSGGDQELMKITYKRKKDKKSK